MVKKMTKPRKTKSRNTGTKKTVKRLSNIFKPEELSLVEWQRTLRRQEAERDSFVFYEVDRDSSPGEYAVLNPHTKNRYTVFYHGEGHRLNSCSCMDFRTSGLGTCKHLESVKLWLKGQRHRPLLPRPYTTRVYMDYSSSPWPYVYYGTEDREFFSTVFGPLTEDGERISAEGLLHLGEAIGEASESAFFKAGDDAVEFAARAKDDHVRNLRLDALFSDPYWWKGVFREGVVPFPYQKEGMAFAARNRKSIIADEMGLGKTIQAIGTAVLLRNEGFISSALVVCPTSLKYQWKKEISNFTGDDAIVIEGNPLQRKDMYSSPAFFKIVSFNTLNNDVKTLGGMDVDMLIMDEVQRLKNWSTQIAKSARKVKSDYSVILSGTPLENKLEELYSIVQLVDQYLLGPYYLFRAEHIICSESGQVTGYKGLNEVGKTLSRALLRRRKSEVSLQLPSRMDKNLFVPMTKEQMDLHEEFKESVARIIYKWRKMHYLSETDRKRLMNLLSMMRMVCDSSYILDQKTRYDTKVEEAMNIIDEIVESGEEKVVVFSGWERMTRLICRELESRGIGFSNLNGSVPSAKRKDLMDRFMEDPAVRVFVSTDAGSTGLNLQVASYVINLDLPWNPAVLEQRIGRIYRLGQKRGIQVVNLVATGTIEERILKKLKFKTDLFDGVLNGGEDTVFLDDRKLDTLVRDLGFVEEMEEEAPSGGLDAIEEAVVEESEIERRKDDSLPQGACDGVSDSPDPMEESASEEKVPEPSTSDTVPAPEEVIAQGVSFFGKLISTLKDPESSRRLVDTIVREDPSTGKASINIPVSDKRTVMQVFDLIGKLLK